ncbi:ABC transporter permease [Propionibacterium sp.]|uniref:ABC transporter permease n=1 Tax=Propionibacterium sp. TaxID=1977903 RepID=UPI0039E8082D
MLIAPSWQVALSVVLIVGLGVAASWFGHLGLGKAIVWASTRGAIQLLAISFIVVVCIHQLWSAALFVLAMFAVAVRTTTSRVEVRRAWFWSALSMAAGVVPVLALAFLPRAAPFNGYSLLPIGSIIIGNMMTAHTLNGQRVFPALRAGLPSYEAALSIGLQRPEALDMLIDPVRRDAVIPEIDSVRTTGLVTLPGAFIGVLLGGGTPLQAGVAQLLVLVGILTGQILTVVTMDVFIRRALLLPEDLATRLLP